MQIADRKNGQSKDFSKVISLTKECSASKSLEEGVIVGRFAHNQVLELAIDYLTSLSSPSNFSLFLYQAR